MNQKAKQILHIADIDKLPSLPHVLLQLLDICHDKNLSFDQLAIVIRQDPSLFAQFHSICHQQKNLDSWQGIEQASFVQKLEQLGVNTIKSIAITATVHQFFSRTSNERTAFLKQHWHHSLYCAIVAESVAKLCNYKQPDEAYTVGLLHDIGQLVIEASHPEEYNTAFAQLTTDDYLHTHELSSFSTTHQQVGAELLKEHGASNFICDAVLYHHERIEHILDAHPLVKITYLANSLTNRYFNTEEQKIFDAAEQLLDLDKTVLLEVLENSQEQVRNAAQSLEIHIASDDMDEETSRQQSASDEFKQIQLAEQVRNIALLDGMHQHLSRSEDQQNALLQIIAQHVCLLFGIKNSILFLYEPANNRVCATSSINQPQQLTELTIPLTTGRSLVSDALISKQITHTFDDDINQLSIIDRQLIGLTKKDGIACLPMLANDTIIGTLVLGADSSQYKYLQKQQPLLMRFVNEIAHTISVNDFTGRQSSPSDLSSADLLQQKIREVLHEVRNPLSIMNNYLGILSYKLESDKPAQEDVQTIKSEINRINEILNRLTDDSDSTDEMTSVSINTIITDLTNFFKTSLFTDKNIQITLDLDDHIGTMQSNPNSLKQIYTNLIKNAVEALPANGEVMVYTQDNVNVDGKQHIEISVADNGPGVDDEILPNLFSPIETEKGGDHAGLGLTIVKNLVSDLHGSISCRSSHEGTSFHILLPK